MATKKETAAADAVENAVETVEKVEAATEEKDDGMVTIHLFKDDDRYSAPVFVGVNGDSYLIQRGMDVKSLPDLPADLFRDQAARRVALGLILAELVKANELKASPEQIKARVEEWADSYEHPEEVIKWYYESPERLEGPENLVLEDNVVEFVLSQAKVNEKAVSFDELMGNA